MKQKSIRHEVDGLVFYTRKETIDWKSFFMNEFVLIVLGVLTLLFCRAMLVLNYYQSNPIISCH